MVKEVEELEKDTESAVKWIAAEFKYANDLYDLLEKVKNEGADAALTDLRKAFRALRYIGRAEHKADAGEKSILEDLRELERILPKNLKEVSEKLVKQLEVGRGKLVKLASQFTGKLKGELKEIRESEILLEHYEDDKKISPDKLAAIKRKLDSLVGQTELEVNELRKWIGQNSAVLEKIEKGFVGRLKELSS